MLTVAQKDLVQNSFKSIATIADDAAILFYQKLFELDPSLKPMFRGDMTEQRKKLMQMLTAAVKGLDRLEQLVPVVQDLGRRHGGLRRQGVALRDGRRGAAVDPRGGPRQGLHAGGEGSLDGGVRPAGDDHEGCGARSSGRAPRRPGQPSAVQPEP